MSCTSQLWCWTHSYVLKYSNLKVYSLWKLALSLTAANETPKGDGLNGIREKLERDILNTLI